MYVELLGIPGAGKTTLAEGVREILKEKDVDCVTRATFFKPYRKRGYKIWWSILNIWRTDFHASLYFFLLYHRTRASFEKIFTRMHEYEKLRRQISKSKRGQVIVWDGGFVQHFANLIALGVQSEDVVFDFIQERMPTDSILVFLNIKVEEAVNRIHKREVDLMTKKPQTVFKRSVLDEQKVIEKFSKIRNAQKCLFERLAESGVRVLELDDSTSVAENAVLLSDTIRKFKSL
jgi:thymidylate kinase